MASISSGKGRKLINKDMSSLSSLNKNFEETIDSLHGLLDFGDQAENTKKNLASAALLETLKRIAEDPKSKPAIDELSKEKVDSLSDFENVINLGGEKFKQLDFNIEELTRESMKSTLEDFVKQLGPDLGSDKSSEVKKIIEKNF